MKKKLTFPLLILVLVLWGAIFYRIFSGLGTDREVKPLQKAPVSDGRAAEWAADDTLLLDYRDPFLTEVREMPVAAEDHVIADDGYIEETPYVDWSQIQYLGSVNNSGSGESIALVMINGREYMLTPGETVDGFTLVRQKGSSIDMKYLGQETTIAMQPGSNEMQ